MPGLYNHHGFMENTWNTTYQDHNVVIVAGGLVLFWEILSVTTVLIPFPIFLLKRPIYNMTF